ncbi:MAG: hypothetical protein NVSMB33_01590 [Ktedonobacteraceae bacterium]
MPVETRFMTPSNEAQTQTSFPVKCAVCASQTMHSRCDEGAVCGKNTLLEPCYS